jgi:hypothetical protein
MKLLWNIFSAWLMKPLYQIGIVVLVVIIIVLFIQLQKAKKQGVAK